VEGDAERARAAVQRTRDGYRGQLLIGAVASAFTYVLPNALRRYRRDRAPLVALSMIVHDDIDPLVEHCVTTVSEAVRTEPEHVTAGPSRRRTGRRRPSNEDGDGKPWSPSVE
jgi:DNA-binding transcriptional LysR family regulator